MKEIVGVRFKKPGKIYFFDPGYIQLKNGDKVIVETASGEEIGEVAINKRELPEEKIANPLKKVIRLANTKDIKHEKENREKEQKAFKVCEEKIKEHELNMHLVEVECKFDNSKIIFYFTADGRIDFRELVKDLAAIYKTRIELRQIGVRDEVRRIGGNGVCGRELCCCSFLNNFDIVSIKMAKEQSASLNPSKISGNCGRLMCCLKNEQEAYEYLNSNLPNVGEKVKTFDGFKGEVLSVNVLRQKVKIVIEQNDEREVKEYSVNELKFKPKKKKFDLASEEIKELKKLEDTEESKLD